MYEICRTRLLLAIVGLALLLVGQTQTEESRSTLRPGVKLVNEGVDNELQSSGDDDDYDDGSADGLDEDDDEDEEDLLTTDDDESFDGSGNEGIIATTKSAPVTQSPCQRKASAVPRGSVGGYRPQCLADGAFKPKQCHGGTGHCWCVGDDGVEIEETRQEASDTGRLECLANGEFLLHETKTTSRLTKLPQRLRTTTDLYLDDHTTTVRAPPGIKGKTEKPEETGENPDDCEGDDCYELQDPQHSKLDRAFWTHPWILAAMIGGAVLALIIIVLLVMFTIYRMRKKDEGSYALNEPKKYHVGYTKAKNEEFFA